MKRILFLILLTLLFATQLQAAVTIKLRGDTAANWTTNDPVLANREPGVETDTGKLKIGDGATSWSSLGYIAASKNLAQFSNSDIDTIGSGSDDPLYIPTAVSWDAVESSCDDTATDLVVTIEQSTTANGTYTTIGTVDPDGTPSVSGWASIAAGQWVRARVTTANTGAATVCHVAFILINQ